MLSLPRIGQEVIVSFQEGDPDQPIITGRVYNAQQIPPGHLPQSKTQMYIKSKTYKGEGYNSLMFDDATKRELLGMHAERDMETLVKHDQRNHIKNNRTLTVNGSQTTQIDRGRSTQITTGNDIKTVLAGNNIETISLLKSTTAKEIFQYAKDRIELEVGEQTSITMDNQQILLRFGKSTILMNAEGIWLDGKHIGLQETDIAHENWKFNDQAQEKRIKDLYWSYGNERINLEEKSRHYSDLNLHIVTENYEEGETVEATIEYDSEHGKETLSVSGNVNSEHEAIIYNVFSNKTIFINGDE